MPTALQVWAGGCPSQTKGRRRRVEWVSMEVSHAVALPLWWSLGLIFPEEWAGRRQITSYFKLEWWLMLGLCYNTTPGGSLRAGKDPPAIEWGGWGLIGVFSSVARCALRGTGFTQHLIPPRPSDVRTYIYMLSLSFLHFCIFQPFQLTAIIYGSTKM